MRRLTLVVFGSVVAFGVAVGGTGAAQPPTAVRSLPCGASVAPDGTVVSVACDDGKRIVLHLAPTSGPATDREIVLAGLPGDARIVDVRAAPFLWEVQAGRVALGLVVRREGKPSYEYRYAVEFGGTAEGAVREWSLSDPIFEDGGKPWRIAEIRQGVADGDTLEILFVRGFLSPRKGGSPSDFEARQFTDTCAGGGAMGIGGKDALTDLRVAR